MNTIKKNVISFVLVMALVLTSVTVMPVSGATNVTTISNLKFAKNDDGSCTITWNKLDGGSYNIYKASSRFAKYEKVGTSSDSSYNDKDYNGEYYKVSFVKDGKEVEPGATVQVQLSLAQVKEGDSASVYHFDETKNEMLDMNANTSADGEVTFGTDHFSKYVIVNHGDNNVTVTIEHYDNSKYQAQDEQSAKIYSDDVCTMAPGAKISDYNKALNWDVDHVQVNGEAFSQSELENIEIHEDSVVKVFYQAKNTDYIGEASFYDYEVIPYVINYIIAS